MEREIRELNREIREMNREMQELKADTREMREMNREIREMNREIRELKADMREMNREMREMQELKANIREMIREMREMQELKADIREMIREMREMQELKGDIREMNREMREMQELKGDIREMNREMREMQELKGDIREMNREMREMQELKGDIREMNREMREMQELKADIRVMKECMQRLSRSVSADWNINARSSLDHQIKKSEEVEFQLLFANKLPDKIFTRDKIRDESDGPVQIKLIDTISRETVELDPLSSMEIQIVVLDGDFGSDGNKYWTEQEFNAKIVQQRKSKGPLVKGKQNVMLRKGVGIIDDLSFYDNSSWKDCGFRLGARVLQSWSMGQARIKEAISEAFVVKDHRTRVYHEKRSKKFDLPYLDNDASPLKKIKKNAKCHTDNNIHTVKDFKQMHGTDINKQIEILKDCSDSDREVIVQDASCVVDDEKLNASSNPILSQTTDPPPHYEFTAPYQGFAGMQNANNHASSSHDHKVNFDPSSSQYISAEEIVPNSASQPQDTLTGYSFDAQGVKSNINFDPLSSEYVTDELLQEIVQNELLQEIVQNEPLQEIVRHDPEWNSSQLNEFSNFPPSRNSYIMTEDSQINKRQNTVMTDQFWNDLNLPNL